MKSKILRLAIVIAITFSLYSCTKKQTETHFTGTIKGLSKGTVYLKKVEDTTLVVLDSISLKGSDSFDFKVNISEPDLYYLHLDKKDGIEFNDLIEVFLEPSKTIHLTTQLDKFDGKLVVKGSENHSRLETFKKVNNNFNKKRFSLLSANLEAVKNNNQDSIALIYSQVEKIIKHKYLYTVNFALTNKEYEVAPYVVMKEIKDAQIKYLDTVYNSLGVKAKVSKYGKQLKDLIAERNLDNSEDVIKQTPPQTNP